MDLLNIIYIVFLIIGLGIYALAYPSLKKRSKKFSHK
jgi:hypothetical protein